MLNSNIIFDELSSYRPKIINTETYDLTLQYAKIILNKDDFDKHKHVLYVTDSSHFQKIFSSASGCTFIILGELDYSTKKLMDFDINLISISDSFSVGQVFNEIQSIFQKYNIWEQKMVLEILNKNFSIEALFQKLMDIGAKMLNNPIALFDISSTLIAYSGDIPQDISSSIWNEVLTTGRYHTEELDVRQRKVAYRDKTLSDEEPIYSSSYIERYGENFVFVNLLFEGKAFATLAATDISSVFTPGQISIVNLLKNILEIAYNHTQHFEMTTEIPNYFIESLFKGEKVEDRVLEYHLNQLNWKVNDTYVLLNIADFHGNILPEVQSAELIKHYEDYFSDYIVLAYENSIIFILNSSKQSFLENVEVEKLEILLSENEMLCGISAEFYDFADLKYAYIQSKSAIKTEFNHEQPNTISYFEEIYKENLISILSEHTSLKSLTHPKLLDLWKDGKITLENLETLAMYFLSGQNIVHTAEKLFIHRNTLSYRINKLEELLEMNFKKLEDDTIFWLYCSCVILQFN